MTAVRFKGTRDELRRIVSMLPGILSGRSEDTDGLAEGFQSAIGFAALSDIRSAYIEKARGGTDEMGIKWEPLAPSTIANRRVGPGASPAAKKREKIRKRETKKAFARYVVSLPEKEARRRAAIVGGLAATRETGLTKEETLGSRDVEILRDTGVLFNSLSPGELAGGEYSKPSEDGGEQQIFEIGEEIVVGTNVAYASVHQHGSGNIPARPFLPSDEYPVPAVWWKRWIGVALDATVSVLSRSLQR